MRPRSARPPLDTDPEVLAEAERTRPWPAPVRAVAAVLWGAFLGAVVALLLLLSFGPLLYASEALFDLGPLSAFFGLAWLAGLVPATVAWLLARSPGTRVPKARSPGARPQ